MIYKIKYTHNSTLLELSDNLLLEFNPIMTIFTTFFFVFALHLKTIICIYMLNQLKGSAKQDLQIGKTDGFNGQTTPFCSSIMIVTIFSYLPYKKKQL